MRRVVLTFAALGLASMQAQTFSETVLHNFASPPKVAIPGAGAIRDSAGNLYGTTEQGGAANAGTVFELSPAGKPTVLYSFTGGADGKAPQAGVIRDASDNLYGTTNAGGADGYGVVFKVSTAGKETVLYSFTGGADGSGPKAGVVRDSSGNFYGTTSSGGASHAGVVYKLSPAGQETVLYAFTGQNDGSGPQAIIRDSLGNLYGTTSDGGSGFSGVVFKVDTAGTETVLYAFQDAHDGGYPNSGLAVDSSGNLYGTTNEGGSLFEGVAFEVTVASGLVILHTFTGGTDGGYPEAGLTMDSEGNVYGTTSGGGLKSGYAGYGVVFKLNIASQQETVLYTFPGGANGGAPNTGVILDSAGNVYGTAQEGTALLGVVYTVDTAGTETVLYGFAGAADGNSPQASLIRDSNGNLYGTTYVGGPANRGVVFKITAAGKEKVLYAFTGGDDGGYPLGGLVRDSAGNLYGTTLGGGTAGAGVVYKLTAAGVESVLYSFKGGADGSEPTGSLVRDAAANFYGTTEHGGTGNCFSGCGVVFKLSAAGVETLLYTFTGTGGAYPMSGVIRDAAGNLYGTTDSGGTNHGVVFEINAAGQESTLYTFTGGADGGQPYGGLVRDSAGNLYGTTQTGGSSFYGTVYKVTPAGEESVLYPFTGKADGGFPYGNLIRDAHGDLYGTTQLGGEAGVVFELSSTGQESVLYSFTGGADGGRPYAGVIADSAGNLYGTAFTGGSEQSGVVFKLTP
jgi:uncharacterized repeat protein (TIGR03803 family)